MIRGLEWVVTRHSPNKLFDSAKLLRRWLTFLRLRVDGETEPSREPVTSASKSVRRGLLFSMVKPEAYFINEKKNAINQCVTHFTSRHEITFGAGTCDDFPSPFKCA